jgi:hypothetical protein
MSEQTRECIDCGERFELTEGQVDWFIQTFGSEAGLPKRCVACRAARRAARDRGGEEFAALVASRRRQER